MASFHMKPCHVPAQDFVTRSVFAACVTRLGSAPGAKMPAERFHELTYDYKWNNAWTKLIAHPTDPSPFVDLEVGSPASWKNAADGVQGAVVVFIHDRMEPKTKKK